MRTDEFDEVEALDAEDRARLLAHKDTFVLSSKHADIIANDLFQDDDAKLGRLFRDLVALNVDGTNDLLDNIDAGDKADRTARRLLYEDCKVFIDRWLLTSMHNANNRKGKTKSASESEDTTAQEDDNNDDHYRPTLDEVKEQACLLLGGLPPEQQDALATRWYNSETKKHWLDDRGEQVRNWRTVFKSYCDAFWKSQTQAGK